MVTAVLPSALSVTALLAFTSGILDGASMIDLTTRTLVIIMLLALAATGGRHGLHRRHKGLCNPAGLWLTAEFHYESQLGAV